jgi:hypothetical protein
MFNVGDLLYIYLQSSCAQYTSYQYVSIEGAHPKYKHKAYQVVLLQGKVLVKIKVSSKYQNQGQSLFQSQGSQIRSKCQIQCQIRHVQRKYRFQGGIQG